MSEEERLVKCSSCGMLNKLEDRVCQRCGAELSLPTDKTELKEVRSFNVTVKLWATIIKYLGIAVFAISLSLIILFSILQIFLASDFLTNAMLVGVALIIIGVIMDKVA